MKTIKFRAWDEYNQTMIYPDEHFFKLKSHEILGRYETVMQFTGLLDKNGKEIYEGDIVEDEDRIQRVVIKFDGGCFYGENQLQYQILNRNWLKWEIIGNIYENPGQIENNPSQKEGQDNSDQQRA